ncbi:MAG: response regulator [Planctomycetes bacterium]|nr:response regulator [Planctomycetota bacterium]
MITELRFQPLDRLLGKVERVPSTPSSYQAFIEDQWRYTMVFGFLIDIAVFLSIFLVGAVMNYWITPVHLFDFALTGFACLLLLWLLLSKVASNPGVSPRTEMLVSFFGLGIVLGHQVAELDSAIGMPILGYCGITFVAAFGIYPARGWIAIARPFTAALAFDLAYLANTTTLPMSQRLVTVATITVFGSFIAAYCAKTFDRIFRHNFRLNHALSRARSQAEQALKARSSFLNKMSHKIRTPLNGVIGSISLLKNQNLPPAIAKELIPMEYSGRTLLEVIESALDLSDQRSGCIQLQATPFSPAQLCQESLEMAATTMGDGQLTFAYEEGNHVPAMVEGDQGRIRQVLINLLGNAVKFTENGQVKIRVDVDQTTKRGYKLRFTISDTGAGIPPDQLSTLFLPFIQADSADGARYQGTGLGLAICKNLVEMMGGIIQASSDLGKGSQFAITLDLPRVSEFRQMNSTAPDGLKQALPANARVLLVEDNAVNRAIGLKMLRQLDLHVDCAKDGVEAVNACANENYDLVLMDCQMPRLDGYGATKQIRASGSAQSSLPIIALTANALAGDRELALDAGMNDYMSKPYDLDGLNTMLTKWLNVDSATRPPAQ